MGRIHCLGESGESWVLMPLGFSSFFLDLDWNNRTSWWNAEVERPNICFLLSDLMIVSFIQLEVKSCQGKGVKEKVTGERTTVGVIVLSEDGCMSVG